MNKLFILDSPLQKKCTWFRSSHDPNLGSMRPWDQKLVIKGSFPRSGLKWAIPVLDRAIMLYFICT